MFGGICVNKRHPCINLIVYNIPIFTHDMIYEKKTFLFPHRRKITGHGISTMHFPVLSIFIFTYCFDCLFVFFLKLYILFVCFPCARVWVRACVFFITLPFPNHKHFFLGWGMLKRIELQKINKWNRSWISRNHIENYSLFYTKMSLNAKALLPFFKFGWQLSRFVGVIMNLLFYMCICLGH